MTSPAMPRQCTCYVVDEKYWFTHYGAVEPGSTMEPNPDCRVHFPNRLEELRAEADRLGTAYTQAIQHACQTRNWYGVPAYAHAAQQARAAVRAAEENQ